MSKDDAGSKRPEREEDPAYITMPPELRPFARSIERKVIKKGDDPILDAAVAAIKVLDGDEPNTDPFYFNVRKRREEEKRREEAETKVEGAAPAKVEAPADVVLTAPGVPLATQAIDLRAFREARGANDHIPEPARPPAPSPAGSAELAVPPVAPPAPPEPKVVLAMVEPPRVLPPGNPSAPTMQIRAAALKPVAEEHAEPAAPPVASAGPASRRPADRSKTTIMVAVALLVVGVVVLVRAITTRTGGPEGAAGGVPSGMPSTAVPPVIPSATPNSTVPPVLMGVAPQATQEPAVPSTAPVTPPSATTSPERHHPAPRPIKDEDPYDASARSLPVVTAPPLTAQPQTTAPAPTVAPATVAPAPTVTPKAAPTAAPDILH